MRSRLLTAGLPDRLTQGPRATMQNHTQSLYNLSKVLFLGAIGLILSGTPARAQEYISGTYNCVSVEVAGKTHSCSAPSLEMNSDGSYQILDERGTYEILKGRWLVWSFRPPRIMEGPGWTVVKRLFLSLCPAVKKARSPIAGNISGLPSWFPAKTLLSQNYRMPRLMEFSNHQFACISLTH